MPHQQHHKKHKQRITEPVQPKVPSECAEDKKDVRKKSIFWRFFGIFMLLGVGLASLISAAWAMGFTQSNAERAPSRIELDLPGLQAPHLIVKVTTKLDSEQNNFLKRHLRFFHRAEGPDNNSMDQITINFMLLGEKFQDLLHDYLLGTNQEITLVTSFPIKRFQDFEGKEFYPRHEKAVLSDYYYYFSMDQIKEDDSTCSKSFQMEPETSLAQEHGLSSIDYVQKLWIASDGGAAVDFSTRCAITNGVNVPFRFDDVHAESNNGTQSGLIGDFTGKIVAGEDNRELPVIDSVLRVKCTDSDAKRLEDFIIFISAAVFGVAIGALLEIFVAFIKERGFQ